MSSALTPEEEEEQRAMLLRHIEFSRRSHELHAKYYRRVALLLSVLSLLGLSAPLVKLMGGDNTGVALVAAVVFVVLQAIDWKMAPGELAGRHSALVSDFHRLARRAMKVPVSEAEEAWEELCDNDIPDSDHIRNIAYVVTAEEQGYIKDVPEEDRTLTGWERFLRSLLKH